MAKIEWRDRMSLGVKELDDDHRAYMNFVNQIEDVVNARAFDERKLAILLDEVQELLVGHFAREELVMERLRYPQYQQHKTLHARALEAWVQLRRNFEAFPNRQHGIDAYNFASGWLVKHNIMTDRDITLYLPKKRP